MHLVAENLIGCIGSQDGDSFLPSSGPGWNLDWHSTKPPGVVPSSAEELISSMFYCVHLPSGELT